MYEISTHRIKKIGVLVYDILIVEKEFVGLEELLLLHHQLVCVFVVLHDLIVFHVVIRDGLSTEHNQGVFIHHVEAHKPYSAVNYCMEDNPRVSLDI